MWTNALGTPAIDPQANLQKALAQCWHGARLLAGFGLVINLLYLVSPLYMLQIYDRVLASQRVETLVALTVVAGMALAIMGVLEMVNSRIQTRMGNWLDRTLSGDLIHASVGAVLQGHAANAQAVRDLGTIRGFVASGLRGFLDLPWMPLFIGAVWLIHSTLGYFAAAAGLVLFLLALVNELLARKPARQANQSRVSNESIVEQAIRNADVLRAMGMLGRLVRLWNDANREVLEQTRRAGDRNAVLFGMTRAARQFAQVGILGLGAYFVIHGEMTAGAMIAASILMGRALAPIEQVTGAWRNFQGTLAAHKRLKLLVGGTTAVERTMPLPAPKQAAIACEGIWFAPKPGLEPVLKSIDFKLAAGDSVALMGPSAAGKTTLCKVLVGSWKPNKGTVRLNGADLHRWSADELGPHLGYLPQDVELFAATVKENIGRLQAEPDPAAVVTAARAAGVHEMILGLPQGYDTLIGPGGHFLSGGQRQRLGLARALFGPNGALPAFIVLDEPNSNLDGAGEEALVAAIETIKRAGSTLVLVTHNSRLLRSLDKVLMLNQGQMQAFGPRDEVLQSTRLKPVRLPLPDQAAERPDVAALRTVTPLRPGA